VQPGRIPPLFAALSAAALFLGAVPAGAQQAMDPMPQEEERGTASHIALAACDLLFVRPVGVARVVTGTLLYGFAGPIGATYGQAGELFHLYVKDGVDSAFLRPLGDFEAL
jgi:hypothetical protein